LEPNHFECLASYTYYLLYNELYDVFDILVQQFETNLKHDNPVFDRDGYHSFFAICNIFADDIITQWKASLRHGRAESSVKQSRLWPRETFLVNFPLLESDNSRTSRRNTRKISLKEKIFFPRAGAPEEDSAPLLRRLRTIIRMIGLMPITKIAFNRHDGAVAQYTTAIMSYLRKYIVSLCDSTEENELSSFAAGLAILTSVVLFYAVPGDPINNEIDFLRHIHDEKRRRTIAHRILQQLYEINEPIYGNSSWTDLFLFVNSEMIDLNLNINLTDSLETYIAFLTKMYAVHEKLVQKQGVMLRLLSRFLDQQLTSKVTIKLRSYQIYLSSRSEEHSVFDRLLTKGTITGTDNPSRSSHLHATYDQRK
jgi:hypothetical protein